MNKFWKNLFTLATVAGGAYLGFKGYQRYSNVTKLSKTLPDYLEDLVDEKPKIHINCGFSSLSIAVGLSAFAIENIDFDLEDQIRRYVLDYYPALGKLKISVSQYIKSSINEDLDDEDFYIEDNDEI